jgi:hypothetical protein
MDRINKRTKALKLKCQKGQSTLEYAMVTVIAAVISAVLIAVANRKKPHRIISYTLCIYI